MSETVTTSTILKTRWTEVALIIGLYGLSLLAFFHDQFFPTNGTIPILFMLCWLLFGVVSVILFYGFLRTVYLEGNYQQSVWILLQVGKHFFWRMCGFGLLAGMAAWILALLIYLLVVQRMASIYLCLGLAMVILLKPLLFIPAVIIVLDCRFFRSFRFLKYCRLFDSKKLAIFSILSLMGLNALLGYLPKLIDSGTTVFYIWRAALLLVSYFLWFVIWLMAVRMVGSAGLVSDRDNSNLDRGNKQRMNCPQCGLLLKVETFMINHTGMCPKCKAEFTIKPRESPVATDDNRTLSPSKQNQEFERINDIERIEWGDISDEEKEQAYVPTQYGHSKGNHTSPKTSGESMAQQQDHIIQTDDSRDNTAVSSHGVESHSHSSTQPPVFGSFKKCANCDRIMGELDRSYDFKGHIVCVECYRRLERDG